MRNKKNLIKVLTFTMALMLLVTCLSGCKKSSEIDESAGFRVQIAKSSKVSDEMWEAYLKELESWSDVPITWDITSAADTKEALALRIASGDYPDIVMSNELNTSDVSNYAQSGVLIPLDEYITEENTPNIWKMFEENPKTKAANYLPDGKMYSLPQLIEFEPAYLERVLYINKVWLDKLNLEVPTTTEELKKVLKAFKTQDPNGNGKADEIPLTFLQGDAYSPPETMLSAWGYATKSGVYDSYCSVKDNKVVFAPMLDEWKEMLGFYRDLYADGSLDMEAFTHTGENFFAKLRNPTSVVGMVWAKTNPMANADEYIAIEPIRADGYDVVWQIHPGIIGNRNCFSIFNSCKNPKAVMHWIDKFYELENSLRSQYGTLGYALNKKNDDGVYTWNEPPAGTSLDAFIEENRPQSYIVAYLPENLFGDTLELNTTMQTQAKNYELYKKYITTEPWPRPYYNKEESEELATIQTDIFSMVNEKMAKWIVGTEDLESGWDMYIENMKNMGVERLVEINQNAYDRFQARMK